MTLLLLLFGTVMETLKADYNNATNKVEALLVEFKLEVQASKIKVEALLKEYNNSL